MDERARAPLVEDDDATLETLAAALRDAFQVWVARSAEGALEVADEISFDADALVVDLGLAGTLRGDQFVAEYRRRAQRDTPVVIVSGVPRAHEIARKISACALLAKPMDVGELQRTIQLVTRGRARHPR